MFTSLLFTEQCCHNYTFWRQLGYLYDVTLQSSAENATSVHGHSTIKNHKQLSVLLAGLEAVQNGNDNHLDNVWLTINGQQKRVKIVLPILYFMNDDKEGDMLCCCMAGHSSSTQCHCCVCDITYHNMLDLNAQCTMKQPQHIEALVDAADHDQLTALSQYCIPSCFCTLIFCDPVHGIFGAQPGDMLHIFNLGIIKNDIIELLDCFTPRQKVMFDDMC